MASPAASPSLSRDQEVAVLSRSAFEAEHQARYQEAYQLHNKVQSTLLQLADDAKFLDRERKRIARKQAKFHQSRIDALQPIVNGQQSKLEVVLPTSISAQESLMALTNGQPSLSFDEIRSAQFMKKVVVDPIASLPIDRLRDVNFLTQFIEEQHTKALETVDPAIKHLIPEKYPSPTVTAPFYTPTLDPDLPVTTYHVYVSSENIFTSGRWFYYKVKDSTERQTLYVLQALKRPHYQIPSTSLSRSAEFTTPCVLTTVKPLSGTVNSTGFRGLVGRELSHQTLSSMPVPDQPDRNKHVQWTPRRFSWGARRFVWKENKAKTLTSDELYEVKREWAKPGSKTGKMEDETFDKPLVWTETKVSLKKVGIIHFRGGMDQHFRELILASWLTYVAVLSHGHD